MATEAEKSATQKSATQKSAAKTTSAKKTKSRTAAKTAKKTAKAKAVKDSETVTILTEAPTATQMPLTPSMAEPPSASEEFERPGDHSGDAASDAASLSKEAADLSKDRTPEEATSPKSARFLAAECIGDNIWVPSAAIPTLDEATYQAQKAQAEAQRRAIEVAGLNLKNINDLHRLERQSLEVTISTKENETRVAQLTSADIDHQIQLEANGEKSQSLRQAAARREAATRESDYADQLIALKDKNFELDIQQAQSVFAEKAARYRAQLTGE